MKEGYYETRMSMDHSERVPPGVTVGRRWPDVTERIMVRPVGNPVPMYALHYSSRIPKEGEEIGYDFLKADWVAPYGIGETVDVLIKIVTLDPTRRAGGEFSWRFPRPGDGMVRTDLPEEFANSQFKMRREAPGHGYISDWRQISDLRGVDLMRAVSGGRAGQLVRVIPEGPLLSRTPFFIRIRSVINETGEVKEAIYGKIVSYPGTSANGVWFTYANNRERATVSFTYYINPDGTRNTEFDPERNLFEGVLRPQARDHFPRWP